MMRMSHRAKRHLLPLAALAGLLAPGVAAAASGPACNPRDPSQVRLQISISGMHSAKGQIVIALYPDQPAHFLKSKYKIGEQHLAVTLPVTHACFAVPAAGYYGVALFDDENGNDHFDLTLLGLPAEGYGFSNNPHVMTGPPGLARVRVPAHAGDNPVPITMQYF